MFVNRFYKIIFSLIQNNYVFEKVGQNRFVISFCRYKGLGLIHKVFNRTNAMLALSGIFKFSAKNITH